MFIGSCLTVLLALRNDMSNGEVHDVLFERVSGQISLKHVLANKYWLNNKNLLSRHGSFRRMNTRHLTVSICNGKIRSGGTYDMLVEAGLFQPYTPQLPYDDQRDQCLDQIRTYNNRRDRKGGRIKTFSSSNLGKMGWFCKLNHVAELAASGLINYQGKNDCWNNIIVRRPKIVKNPESVPIVIADMPLSVMTQKTQTYKVAVFLRSRWRPEYVTIASVGPLTFAYYKKVPSVGYIMSTDIQAGARPRQKLYIKKTSKANWLSRLSLVRTRPEVDLKLGCGIIHHDEQKQ